MVDGSLRRQGSLGIKAISALVAWLWMVPGAEADPDPPTVNYESFFRAWPGDEDPNDEVPRFLEEGQRLTCNRDGLIRYRSQDLRYSAFVRPEFADRLARFDAFVKTYSETHYGRAPRRMVHRGTFNCRTARGRRGRISEHALGNAIDLTGFDFPRLPRGSELPEGAPTHLRRAFQIRVRRHWSPRRSRDHHHARFLHGLAEAVRGRTDLFRGIVGPPRPRHADHLHLDAAPWQYSMFGYDPVSAPE